ncbi:polyphosphate kinase [Treponema primitia ZAS-2]|uniref:Polyphosphate kinase n=1 Tax=Treponema primitia (strain ATCC BAA-887 / DSM 12427 / ZAS-2) TaxID=545694 RepID=F5YK18_TREPZ|nr:polyphosphate kinase 1 [Treponema primitia]AEF86062.1 polyphosphate kinase [Treponema primitia ZAS-2]
MTSGNNLSDKDTNILRSSLPTAHFFNRDLSWIDFNGRVLEEGLRQDLPPLDRFWYFSIFSSNFDGFFMVRVAAMKQALRAGAGPDPSGLRPEEQLSKTAEKTRSMILRQYDCLQNELFPLLAREGLELVRPDTYSITQMDYLESYFLGQVYPILTPLRIEADEKLPFISGNDLNVAFLMEPEQADGEAEDHIAIIQLPHALDRIIWLPRDTSTDSSPDGLPDSVSRTCWALLEDLVLTWGAYLFPGYRVKETMLFRINRDADFSVDEKRDEDFIEAMEEVIEGRTHSPVVRMTFSSGSHRLRDELARRLGLEEQDLYEIDGPLDLGSLMDLASARDFDSLRSKAWKVYPSAAFNEEESLWDRISQRDVMLHLPYESFDPVVRFFQDAATDPQVISIKTALYRTSGNSPVIKALEQAALNGKHVTAVVELKARFDEERNISWANRLEKAGVIVVYGLARLKVHAKISMIIRREKEGIKRYVHLSTGNYNDKTARQYDDLGLFTSREEIALDASIFFNMITGYSVISSMRKLVIAPTSLKRRVLELIDRETKRSNQEHPGKIIAKLNALADTDVVEALYRASQAGVKIVLVVRGICTLIPGVPGLSENIRVISIIGHYLEHSRIYYFSNGGAEEYYLASADWMPRNLERRVELMFPVLQEDIKVRLRKILDSYCRDNQQARELKSDASWRHLAPAQGEDLVSAQEHFLAAAAKAGGNFWTPRNEFVVRRGAPGGQ